MKKLGFKIWLYIIVLVLTIMSIFIYAGEITFFQKGVLITSVEQNSSTFNSGLRQGQIITAIDGEKIDNLGIFKLHTKKISFRRRS